MNGKSESSSFRHRIYWYVVITAVVQFSCGILGEITSHGRGPIAVLFYLLLYNFAYLLLGISYTLYPIAIIIGTFFMFLMIAIGEFFHQIGTISVPPDPLEESRRSARSSLFNCKICDYNCGNNYAYRKQTQTNSKSVSREKGNQWMFIDECSLARP